RGLHHNGGRLVFGPDGMLYASTGESGNKSLSQDLDSLGGKNLRMTPARPPPPTNPFPATMGSTDGPPSGEGLALDAAPPAWAARVGGTGVGEKAYDGLNLVLPGHDYGWPATQGFTSHPGYTGPKAEWPTDECGPSGIAVRDGVAWIAALTGQRIWRVALKGT